MDDRFVPLATYVRNARAGVPAAPGNTAGALPVGAVAAVPVEAPTIADFAHADIVSDLTTMRLAARETLERTARRVIEDLAHDVLARELALAPADLEALVAQALATFANHEPIALAVSTVDRERVHASLPIRTDATLSAGDLVVYVRDGAFESPFGFRLADALERCGSRVGA